MMTGVQWGALSRTLPRAAAAAARAHVQALTHTRSHTLCTLCASDIRQVRKGPCACAVVDW